MLPQQKFFTLLATCLMLVMCLTDNSLAAVSSPPLSKPDANGYSCYLGVNGRDANFVADYCKQQAQALFKESNTAYWQNAARSQGFRVGYDPPGTSARSAFITIPPGKTWEVPYLDACKYTIRNTGKSPFNSHTALMKWVPQFITDRCPKLTSASTNVQAGLSASFGGVLSSTNTNMVYTITARQ